MLLNQEHKLFKYRKIEINKTYFYLVKTVPRVKKKKEMFVRQKKIKEQILDCHLIAVKGNTKVFFKKKVFVFYCVELHLYR